MGNKIFKFISAVIIFTFLWHQIGWAQCDYLRQIALGERESYRKPLLVKIDDESYLLDERIMWLMYAASFQLSTEKGKITDEYENWRKGRRGHRFVVSETMTPKTLREGFTRVLDTGNNSVPHYSWLKTNFNLIVGTITPAFVHAGTVFTDERQTSMILIEDPDALRYSLAHEYFQQGLILEDSLTAAERKLLQAEYVAVLDRTGVSALKAQFQAYSTARLNNPDFWREYTTQQIYPVRDAGCLMDVHGRFYLRVPAFEITRDEGDAMTRIRDEMLRRFDFLIGINTRAVQRANDAIERLSRLYRHSLDQRYLDGGKAVNAVFDAQI